MFEILKIKKLKIYSKFKIGNSKLQAEIALQIFNISNNFI